MIDYDEDVYSQLAMRLLEHDIHYWCERYYVPGYDIEDLEQECRIRLWTQIQQFNPDKDILLRSWAKVVIKNHLKNLLRNALRQKRGGMYTIIPLDGNIHYQIVDVSDDLNELLDKCIEKGINLPDYY